MRAKEEYVLKLLGIGKCSCITFFAWKTKISKALVSCRVYIQIEIRVTSISDLQIVRCNEFGAPRL